jgi:hypothetical protein
LFHNIARLHKAEGASAWNPWACCAVLSPGACAGAGWGGSIGGAGSGVKQKEAGACWNLQTSMWPPAVSALLSAAELRWVGGWVGLDRRVCHRDAGWTAAWPSYASKQFNLGNPGCLGHAQVIGQAFGNAAMLLAAGKKGYRYALPHSRIMTCPPRMNRCVCSVHMGNAGGTALTGPGRGAARKME